MVPIPNGEGGESAERLTARPRTLANRIANPLALVVTGFWGVTSLWIGSDAGLSLPAAMWVFGGAVVLFFAWLVSLVRSTRPTRKPPFPRRWLRFLVAPLFVIVCAVAVFTGLAFRVRFAWGRADLEAYVHEVTKTPPAEWDEQEVSVGVFRVLHTQVLPGGIVRLITTTCGFDDCGVVYSPHGPPPVIGEDSYTEIGDGWWRWWQSW